MLADEIEKQITFAVASSLTAVAKEGQAAEVADIRETFTVRNNWPEVGPYAIKVEPATKTKLEAHVYTMADWMEIQEFGGTKVSHSGGALAVPTDEVRPDESRIIPKAQRPRNIKGAFILQTKKGPVLAIRQGKEIKVLYGLESKVNVQARPTFIMSVEKVVNNRFEAIFSEKLDEALKTAR